MEYLKKVDERSIWWGLAELFALLGLVEGGIAASLFRIDSCKYETLKPGKGSETFDPFPGFTILTSIKRDSRTSLLVYQSTLS